MKTLTELYDTPLSHIKRPSLAGLYARNGHIRLAALIASKEGDLLFVDEILEKSRSLGLGLHDEVEVVMADSSISSTVKSVCSLALAAYGALRLPVDYIEGNLELQELLVETIENYADDQLAALARATEYPKIADACFKEITARGFPSFGVIKKLMDDIPRFALTEKQKKHLLREWINQDMSEEVEEKEEMAACEALIGRNLTQAEIQRRAKRYFRNAIKEGNLVGGLNFVWNQGRKLNAQERRMMYQDARSYPKK